jgi:UDP-2-acetamido-3-amino-2,3-dideoxy-glucuronate N-acetyltransferase
MTNGCQPRTDGGEGLQVLKILNASQRSLDQQGKKINLDWKFTASELSAAKLEVSNNLPSNIDPTVFVHESAIVDPGVNIGASTKIWHFAHVLSGSRIDERCNIGQNVMIGPDVKVGKGCKIQNNVSIYKGVTLEDGVFCGPSMVFTNIYNPRAEISKMDQVRPTMVKTGTTIGANATIVCGTILGRYSFIGAGAVVTHNVPDHALVLGNPARQIGWMCECGERLTEDLECLQCGEQYQKSATGLTRQS